MTKTANYQLNQWEPTDKLSRADFNADNAAIDAALANKAEKSAVTAVESGLASKASAAEVGALSQSVSALSTALGSKGNCRIATGSYTGTGTYGADNPNSLSFDFSPSIIIMRGNYFYTSVFIRSSNFTTCCAQNSATMKITWTEHGVSWYNADDADYQNNANGNTYYYIALG